jgi:hypothetical protein
MPKTLPIPELDARASKALADANLASERGHKAKAEKLYEKAQYWLDKLNQALGNN